MGLAHDIGSFAAFIGILQFGSIFLIFPLCSGYHPDPVKDEEEDAPENELEEIEETK